MEARNSDILNKLAAKNEPSSERACGTVDRTMNNEAIVHKRIVRNRTTASQHKIQRIVSQSSMEQTALPQCEITNFIENTDHITEKKNTRTNNLTAESVEEAQKKHKGSVAILNLQFRTMPNGIPFQ